MAREYLLAAVLVGGLLAAACGSDACETAAADGAPTTSTTVAAAPVSTPTTEATLGPDSETTTAAVPATEPAPTTTAPDDETPEPKEPTTTRDGDSLADTEWRLVALGNADDAAAGNATAEFTATDMTGWTGCNSYAARYRERGSRLRLYDLEWTEAGCPSQALFQQEQRLQDSLRTVDRFEVSGGQLTLHSEDGRMLVFERVGK